ncbi:MAG: FAD:protein FMN transferase [Clostridia bacterium]|nr:FAD:protein FMN transferase [Clostridia bacterium]
MKRLLPFLLFCLLLTGCSLPGKTPEYSQTHFLMDTVCTIRSDSKSAILAGFSMAREVQDATDFYDENSTVSAFNRADAGVPVPLDSHTYTIVATALKVSEASGGAFDITVAPAKALWDFAEGALPPEKSAVAEVLPRIGWEKLLLDTETQTLTKREKGVAIDLGGCAKGYAADMAKNAMIEAGAAWGVLDFGGNVVVFGKNPARKDGGWEIGIQAPNQPAGTYARTVPIEDAGTVVTSGTYQRRFSYNGTLFHHILDPKTGFPAETESQSATVTGNSALYADCLSTACLILGREKGTALADRFYTTVFFTD